MMIFVQYKQDLCAEVVDGVPKYFRLDYDFDHGVRRLWEHHIDFEYDLSALPDIDLSVWFREAFGLHWNPEWEGFSVSFFGDMNYLLDASELEEFLESKELFQRYF